MFALIIGDKFQTRYCVLSALLPRKENTRWGTKDRGDLLVIVKHRLICLPSSFAEPRSCANSFLTVFLAFPNVFSLKNTQDISCNDKFSVEEQLWGSRVILIFCCFETSPLFLPAITDSSENYVCGKKFLFSQTNSCVHVFFAINQHNRMSNVHNAINIIAVTVLTLLEESTQKVFLYCNLPYF